MAVDAVEVDSRGRNGCEWMRRLACYRHIEGNFGFAGSVQLFIRYGHDGDGAAHPVVVFAVFHEDLQFHLLQLAFVAVLGYGLVFGVEFDGGGAVGRAFAPFPVDRVAGNAERKRWWNGARVRPGACALSPIRPENGDCDDGNRQEQQPAQTSHGVVKTSLTDARVEQAVSSAARATVRASARTGASLGALFCRQSCADVQASAKLERSHNSRTAAFVRSSLQKFAPLNPSCIVHGEQLDSGASNRRNTFDDRSPEMKMV